MHPPQPHVAQLDYLLKLGRLTQYEHHTLKIIAICSYRDDMVTAINKRREAKKSEVNGLNAPAIPVRKPWTTNGTAQHFKEKWADLHR